MHLQNATWTTSLQDRVWTQDDVDGSQPTSHLHITVYNLFPVLPSFAQSHISRLLAHPFFSSCTIHPHLHLSPGCHREWYPKSGCQCCRCPAFWWGYGCPGGLALQGGSPAVHPTPVQVYRLQDCRGPILSEICMKDAQTSGERYGVLSPPPSIFCWLLYSAFFHFIFDSSPGVALFLLKWQLLDS